MDFEVLRKKATELVVLYTPKVIAAILILIIGFSLVKILIKMIDRILKKSKVDLSLHSFMKSILDVLLKVTVVITAASTLGVKTATFVAILSTIGLAIGLAIKDSLSNLAGGVLLLSFRPFNVGDYIEAKGKAGTVKRIEILYTYINTPDNKRIVIPNGQLANTEITNYTAENERRVDLTFSLAYDCDMDELKTLLTDILNNYEHVLKIPSPEIRVESIENNSVNIIVKAWTRTKEHLETYYDLQELIKKKIDGKCKKS